MERLTVTAVKPHRGFLAIYGYKKKELLTHLDAEISAYQPYTKRIVAQPELHPIIEFDKIYLALITNTNQYHRCIVVEKRPNNKAIIELIDYGTEYEVDTSVMLELDPKNRKSQFLTEFPPIVTKFILLSFFSNWKHNELQIIESLLINRTMIITNEQTDREHSYIALSLEGEGGDVATKFINSMIGMDISFTEQRMEILKIDQRSYNAYVNVERESPAKREKRRNLQPTRPLQQQQQLRLIQNHLESNTRRTAFHADFNSNGNGGQPASNCQFPTFTATELPIGQYNMAYCSYVEDGPNLFWLQLKSQEHILDRLANDLMNAPRNPIEGKMRTGMACLARFSEDKALYRAVLQNVLEGRCRVTFVDYGNSEFVPFSELYAIPSNFLELKQFAMPFHLSGCKEHLGQLDDKIKEYFKDLLNDNAMDVKVVPTNKIQVQECELYTGNGLSVLQLLIDKQREFNTYPNPPPLMDNDMVGIRYAITAKQFYVHRQKDTLQYNQMMDSLYMHCMNTTQMLTPPVKGQCCAMIYENDWYRVVVLDAVDPQQIQVQFVDYGNSMSCRLADLRHIPSEYLTLPRQAIECCLVDFEHVVEVPESTQRHLDMLMEDSNCQPILYRVNVRNRLQSSAYVVDLYNEKKDVSVSTAVFKLAMPLSWGKKGTKYTNESVKNGAASRSSNSPIVRECDGAEQLEKFQETTDRQNERARNGNDENGRHERSMGARARVDNGRHMPNGNSPRGQGSRADYDNRRNGENPKKTNDKSDNWDNTAVDSSGFHSTHDSSKSPEKQITKSPVTPATEEMVGFNPIIPDAVPIPVNSISKMSIVYWNSPFEFFMQLKSMYVKCDEMMYQIQKFYKNRAPIQQKIPIGSMVIVRHRDDQQYKRANVIDYNESRNKYKVQLIDFGIKVICQSTELFEMEKSFTKLPATAVCCKLGDHLILNKSVDDIQVQVIKYLTKIEEVDCTVLSKDDEKITVDVSINGNSLTDMLIQDKSLSKLTKDISLKQLVGQTLMPSIAAITDPTHFQAVFHGCDIAFMCSYKDLSVIKKNPQLTKQMQSSLNKYIKIKVDSIDSNNMLLATVYFDGNNNSSEICDYPVFNKQFVGLVSHIELPCTIYVQSARYAAQEQQLLNDLYTAYEHNESACQTLALQQHYVALSSDSNFYRCRIEQFQREEMVKVRFTDYGNTEVVHKSAIKELAERFRAPIYALAQKMYVPIEMSNESSFDWTTPINVHIVGVCGSQFVCDLEQNGTSLIKTLADKALDISQLEAFLKDSERKKQLEEEQQQMQHTSKPREDANNNNGAPSKEIVEDIESTSAVTEPKNELEKLTSAAVKPTTEAFEPTNDAVELTNDVIEPTNEVLEPAKQHIEPSVAIQSTETIAEAHAPAAYAPAQTDLSTNQSAGASSKRELAFITHMDHPNRFYMQLNSDSDAIENLQQALQIVAPQLPALNVLRAGQMCIANCSLDGLWYRAKIIDTDGEITSIQFIDYGNTDSITDNALLKLPEDNLIAKEPLAMACSLPLEPRGSTEWAESSFSKLRMVTGNDVPLEFEIISQDKDVNYVKLFFVGGRDLVREMIQEEVAEPLEIVKSGERCFVCHFNSLNDFFIQVDSDSEVLRKIEQHLQDASNNSESLVRPSVGMICTAPFDDGGYYRARILRALADGFEVEFLDYGNTCQSNDLRVLSAEIAQLPYLRKRCSLKLPDDVQSWSDVAENRFQEISQDGATEFVVNLVKPGKTATVELQLGTDNLSVLLADLCTRKPASPVIVDEEQEIALKETTSVHQHTMLCGDFPSGKQPCYLSNINSPADFYIQFADKTDDLNAVAAELASSDQSDEMERTDVSVGEIVAALFPADGYFYRAKVLEQLPHAAVVFFLDYGNKCEVTEMRKLSSILSAIVPLAAQCSLTSEKLARFTAVDERIFSELIQQAGELTFQVEAISNCANKTTVNFYLEDEDILAYVKGVAKRTDTTKPTVLSDIIEESTDGISKESTQ